MPTVAIYRRDSELIAVATGQTTMGVNIETGSAVTLPMDIPKTEIGLEIKNLFLACGATVEHPKALSDRNTPVLKQAQCSCWADFMRARPDYLTLTMTDSEFLFERWRRDGKGFAPCDPRLEVSLPLSAEPESIGAALLGLCKTTPQNKAEMATTRKPSD